MFKSFSQSRGRSLFRHLFGHWSLLYFGRLAGSLGCTDYRRIGECTD